MLALIEFAEILRYGGRENYAAITEASGGDYLTFRFSMPKLLRLHFAFRLNFAFRLHFAFAR